MRTKQNKAKRQESRFLNTKAAFLLLAPLFFSLTASAQCAMCRAALEGEGNAEKAQAVNDGIVYLMAIPYILVAGVGYYVYRMRQKSKE